MEALDANTETDAVPSSTVEPNENWTRQIALQMALDHHRANGGMHQANQVVATATVFLDFITGENK